MQEREVSKCSKAWLEKQGYDYKGVCSNGHVPVPTITKNEKVLIDGMGEKRENGEPLRLWIEDKGSNANLSTLLEGFSRICFAVFYGGGDGLLGIPHDRIRVVNENQEFFKRLADVTVGKGRVGLLDVEKEKINWF